VTTNTKTKTNTHHKKIALTLLFLTILITSLLICYRLTTNNTNNIDEDIIVDKSIVDETVSLEEAVYVKSEKELTTTIDNAKPNTLLVIALDKDITLTKTLTIPTNKNITLTSKDHNTTFYKLIGADNASAITVNSGGVLTLTGIIVTHETNYGTGVVVTSGGKLNMYSGKIANNIAHRGDFNVGGGGVYNNGVFTMYGGIILDNLATDYNGGCGGGIYNNGTFSMYGGEISGNSALEYTGGRGGGVFNFGIFTMYGGTFFNNTADSGGGIYNYGTFEMLDGTIDNNTVKGKPPSHASGGDNPGVGGGVCNVGTFTMLDGAISNNKATSESSIYCGCGGGVMNYGTFKLLGGKISGNTATTIGGGICVYNEEYDKLVVGDGVVFENNRASKAYNRASAHDSVYNSHIGNKVTWSTPFTQGYNNYDISYTNGTRVFIFAGIYIISIIAIVIGAAIIAVVCVFYFYISKKTNIR
jgi:hypothetical protein